MKVCTGCKKSKELSEFHRKGEGYQAQCKVCRTAYDRDQYQNNPAQRKVRKDSILRYKKEFREWYNSLKEEPCSDCGIQYHFSAMEWDHIPGKGKSENLSTLAHYGNKKKVLEEIEKCELVCSNCHSIRTYFRSCGERSTSGSIPEQGA